MRTAHLFLLALAVAGCAADFCSSGEDGAPGSYVQSDAAEVPDEVLGVILDAFPDANLTLPNGPFSGCSNISVTSLDACTQVVSGENYKVLAALICEDGSFDNEALEAIVEAIVYQPLDAPAELTSIDLVGSSSISTFATPMCPADIGTLPHSDIPEDVGILMLKTVMDVSYNKSCLDSQISYQPACIASTSTSFHGGLTQDTGSDYLLTAHLTCNLGMYDDKFAVVEIIEVKATIFLMTVGGETPPVVKDSSYRTIAMS